MSRGRANYTLMREIVGQPDVYFTTGRPLPIRICNSVATMPSNDTDPDGWFHPDVVARRVPVYYDSDPAVVARVCRMCGVVVLE